MFVSKSMNREVVTVRRETLVLEAKELMHDRRIRHLPVVDEENRLVGIITDRDLRSALPLSLFRPGGDGDPEQAKPFVQVTVADVMTVNPLTIAPTHTLQDALLLIQEKKVGAFPVVDENGKLMGILSTRDLLRAFINVLGIGEPGTLLCILAEDRVGQMKKIVDAITEENISLGSVLVARYWERDKRAVFPYLLTNNVARIKKKLKDLGFELLDPMQWYIDHLPRPE